MDKPKLTSCEACGNQVSTQASACPQCGHPIQHDEILDHQVQPATIATPPVQQHIVAPTQDELRLKLRAVARYQRHICYYLVFVWVVVIGILCLAFLAPDVLNGREAEAMFGISLIGVGVYSIYIFVCSIMLAAYTLKGAEWVIFIVLILLCGYLFGLIYASVKATALLRANGYKVGLMGANSAQFIDPQESVQM